MTNGAMVAIEIVDTVATRSPVRIAGSASGSSTRLNDCARVKPEPRAASTTLSVDRARRPSIMFR